MNFAQWVNRRIGKLRWFDIGLLKLASACFILFIAKLWPDILSLDAYWYLILTLVIGYMPFYRFYCAR